MYHHNYPPNQAPGQQATGGFQPPQLTNSNMAALNYPPLGAPHHPSQMNHPHSMPPGYPPHSAGPVSNHPAHQMPPGHMPNAPPHASLPPPPGQMMPPSNYHPGKLPDNLKQHHEQQMYGMRPPMHPSGKPISYQQSMQPPPPNLYGPPHQSQMPHATSSAPHSHHLSMPPHSTPYSQQPPGHHPYHHQTGPPVSMHQPPPPMLGSASDPQQSHHQQAHYQMSPNDYHMRPVPGPNYSPYNYPQPPPNGYNSKYQPDGRLMNAATSLPTNLPTPQQQPQQQQKPQPQIPTDSSNLSSSQNGKLSSGLS